MNLDKLRINQLSPSGWRWYQDYLDALDAYDMDRYATFLAEGVTVAFNNTDPTIGLDAAKDGLGQLWASVTAMGYTLLHEPLNIYGTDDAFVLEALNHYTIPGQPRITIHAAAFTDRPDNGKVTAVRLYQDLTPLYTPTT